MDIMIDIETTGTEPGCAILSIGAVAFDPKAGLVGKEFYAKVSHESCRAAGLTDSQSTLGWWAKQSAEARDEAFSGQEHIANVLQALTRFVLAEGVKGNVWGHGPSFDMVNLEAAYRAVGLQAPWPFWAHRCTRTLYEIAGVSVDRSVGTHHNALDDARQQAVAAIEAYRKLGLAA